MGALAAAVVLAGASFTVASAVDSSRHHDHDVATPGFTVTSQVYAAFSGASPSTSCVGTPALLYPGVVRCLVFSVHNNTRVPLLVQSIHTVLDSHFSPPPRVCSGPHLLLPDFTGALVVASDSTARSPGVPVVLRESGTNQDACENLRYHFTYSATAVYTDTTSTSLSVTPNPSLVRSPTTLRAVVVATNAPSDSNSPSGVVAFDECPTLACTVTTPLASVPIDGFGRAAFTTSDLSVGSHYLEAVYSGRATDFAGSTSPVVTLQVVAPTTGCQDRSGLVDPGRRGQIDFSRAGGNDRFDLDTPERCREDVGGEGARVEGGGTASTSSHWVVTSQARGPRSTGARKGTGETTSWCSSHGASWRRGESHRVTRSLTNTGCTAVSP